MKILSILAPVKFGGGERLLLDQVKFFRQENIDYIIVCLNRSKEFENLLEKEKIKFYNLTNIHFKQTPTKRDYLLLFFKLLLKIFHLRKIILVEKPEVLIANGFPVVFLVPLSILNFNLTFKIFYIHHSIKSKENFIIKKIYLWFLKKYKKIIGVSSLTEKTLKDVFPEIKDKILSIPNGIDTGRFDIKESKTELRRKLNLPDGILGINIGRLTHFKNQKFLIKLAKEVDKDNFYIFIIGDGDEYENLIKEIRNENLENKIKLLGFASNELIPYYLKACDIFLFPSLKEGFGIVVLEAMASGLPVVIFKDIYVEEFGKSILVANNEKEFIEYTKKLCENEKMRIEIGELNKNYCRNNLDSKITNKKYQRLFEE